jgi:hypothetical protein
MEPGARVTSIEAIRGLRSAFLKFDTEVRDGVDSLSMQVRRAVEWLEVDRMQYWPAQLRRANERLVEARNALERCQLRYGSEEAPSCYEQKQAVEAATRRFRLCEEKLRTTKKWIRALRQEVNAFEGQLAKMNNCIDADVPRAVSALDRMIDSLEKYVEVSPSVSPTRKGESQPDGAATRRTKEAGP